jgi:hypothetical protein
VLLLFVGNREHESVVAVLEVEGLEHGQRLGVGCNIVMDVEDRVSQGAM